MEYGIDLSRRPTPRSPVRDAGRCKGREPVSSKEVRARGPGRGEQGGPNHVQEDRLGVPRPGGGAGGFRRCPGEVARRHHQGGSHPHRHQPELPAQQRARRQRRLGRLRHRRRQQDRRCAGREGGVRADRDPAARALPGRRQDRHLAGGADPFGGARQADRVHRAAAQRGHGGADHRQGHHHRLEAAQRPQVHARRYARQLVGRLPEEGAAERQDGAGRHHRRHRPPGRPGPRRRDRREHRLLHEAHQELSRHQVEGAAQPDRRRLVPSASSAATTRCATRSTSFSTRCIPAISSTRPGRSGTARRCWRRSCRIRTSRQAQGRKRAILPGSPLLLAR